VQTPSKRSFIESHTRMPLYGLWPKWMKDRLRHRLEIKDPKILEQVDSMHALSRDRLWKFFPDAKIYVERSIIGMEKSFAAYRTY
jgi:hypothetical protein